MKRKLRGIASIMSLSLFLSSLTGTLAHASTFDLATGDGTVACSLAGSFAIDDYVVIGEADSCRGDAEIPEGVTEIASYAFVDMEGLVTISIPSTTSVIGDFAFSYLYDLTSFTVAPSNPNYKAEDEVLFSKNGGTLIKFPTAKSASQYRIPGSVTSIGSEAFYGVSLGTITIPSGVVNIGQSAFSQTGLTAIEIPEGVENIDGGAFSFNPLTRIHLPASVMTIGTYAFSETLISEFSVEALNASFKTEAGVLFTKNGQTLLNYPVTNAGPYVIPAGVTWIGDGAFAFAEELTEITIPATVTIIGKNAFTNCGALSSVTFSDGSQLTTIGESAFNNAGPITEITIPAGVTSIPNYAFRNLGSLRSVTFAPNSQMTSIGYSGFGDATSLEAISIPASVKSIDDFAFFGASSLSSLTFAQNSRLESIGYSAFQYARSLTSVNIPASVKSIGSEAFLQDFNDQNSLTTVSFSPNSQLVSIGEGAFRGTNALTGIVIPASVKTIGSQAFSNYSYDFDAPMSLTSVAFESGSQLTTIGNSAFANQRSLTGIVIPASVTSIGNNAFQWTRRLTSLTFAPNSQLRTIGDFAFENARLLTSVVIPVSVVSIGFRAFSFNSALSSFVFESGSQLSSISEGMLTNSGLLPSITIPSGVISIGSNAFPNLESNASVYFLGNAPRTISSDSFRSGVAAYRSNCATGFPEGSSNWNGLALSVSELLDPCLVIYYLDGGYGLSSGTLDSNGRVAQAPTPPSKTGYTFANWSGSNGGEIIGFPFIPGTEGSNITLYASWTPNTNTVIFDSRGGSSVPNGSFVTGGAIAAAPAAPTREGCIFLGWESWAEGYEGGIVFPYEPGVLEGITLYGFWRVDPTSVSADCEPRAGIQTIPNASNLSTGVQNPNPPQNSPQSNPPQVPPVISTSPVANFRVIFSSGSKVLATSYQKDLKIMVEKSGLLAKYTVSASASMVRGLPRSYVSRLAGARAATVRSYLMKLGVLSANISTKLVINKIGQSPTTKIMVIK